MHDFQVGPGLTCNCCHDDAQGIDASGLCPSCRKYTAELRAEIDRLERELTAERAFVMEYHDAAQEVLAMLGNNWGDDVVNGQFTRLLDAGPLEDLGKLGEDFKKREATGRFA